MSIKKWIEMGMGLYGESYMESIVEELTDILGDGYDFTLPSLEVDTDEPKRDI